jgi:hypothetical protein
MESVVKNCAIVRQKTKTKIPSVIVVLPLSFSLSLAFARKYTSIIISVWKKEQFHLYAVLEMQL